MILCVILGIFYNKLLTGATMMPYTVCRSCDDNVRASIPGRHATSITTTETVKDRPKGGGFRQQERRPKGRGAPPHPGLAYFQGIKDEQRGQGQYPSMRGRALHLRI